MNLVFDRRPLLGGSLGTHALVVGISAYRYLASEGDPGSGRIPGLVQLPSAALSAFRIYSWLVERADHLARPLATCRLLLSPSAAELAAEPQLKSLGELATMENFLQAAYEWRADAATNRDNATFFYQASHGFERAKGDFVLLCEDAGHPAGPVLRNAYDFHSLYEGMAASWALPTLARTQFYFVDAGRADLQSLRQVEQLNTTPVFDAFLRGLDDRTAPVFYAAKPGGHSDHVWPRVRGQTLFSDALLRGLNGEAAVLGEDAAGNAAWCVSTTSLGKALDVILAEWAYVYLVYSEGFQLGGLVADAVIHYLDAAPPVELSLLLEPAEAVPFAVVELELLDEEGETVWHEALLGNNRALIRVPAGMYLLRVRISPPSPNYRTSLSRILQLRPPRTEWKVNVAQPVDGKASVTP